MNRSGPGQNDRSDNEEHDSQDRRDSCRQDGLQLTSPGRVAINKDRGQ